jgi:hypothetical protein
MASDKWSEWLLHKRCGGDAKAAEAGLAFFKRVRDRGLDQAASREGLTVLDVGAGDGLIAFGALERVRETPDTGVLAGQTRGLSSRRRIFTSRLASSIKKATAKSGSMS